MKIQVLGTVCPRCEALAAHAHAAAEALGLDYCIEKVTDLSEIIKLGVMTTPALIVDGEVKVMGTVPGVEAVKELLKNG